MSLTIKEIKDQYNALMQTSALLADEKDTLASYFAKEKPASITFLGCGSSYSLAKSMQFITSTQMGIRSYALAGGDLWLNVDRYKEMLKGTMIVTISRSGSTSEILNAIEALRKFQEVKVISIACVKDSALAKLSDVTLEMPWAFDESVCQTRTVSCMYAAGAMMIAAFAKNDKLTEDLNHVINHGDYYISKNEESYKAVAKLPWDSIVVLADGEIEGLAEEGSLAFKEISQLQSNYYHILDSRHGPMVLIGEKTLVIVALTSDNKYEQSLVSDLLKKGATIVTTSQLPSKIDGVYHNAACEFAVDHIAAGLLCLNACQLISYYKALEVGTDPDAPDGLDAWIKI